MCEGVLSFVGAGGARTGTNTGTHASFKLKPRNERPLSADQVIRELRPKLSRHSGFQRLSAEPASIQIGGQQSKSQYQYTLQDLDQNELQPFGKLVNCASPRRRASWM